MRAELPSGWRSREMDTVVKNVGLELRICVMSLVQHEMREAVRHPCSLASRTRANTTQAMEGSAG